MIIPIRCFSCGSVIAGKYEKYKQLLEEGKDSKEALDSLGLSRYCCRRMILSQKDFIDETIRLEEKGP